MTKYNDLITDRMDDKQKFNILYQFLEGEAEVIYNRHSSEKNCTLALTNVWRALDDTFGYWDRNPLTEINERSTQPAVEYTIKGMRTLLSDVVFLP